MLVKHHKAYLKKHDGVRLNSTTLHLAALEGQKEIVELLIANGADVNAMDESGHTPLDDLVVMDSAKWNEIADLLRKHGGKTKRELEAADN